MRCSRPGRPASAPAQARRARQAATAAAEATAAEAHTFPPEPLRKLPIGKLKEARRADTMHRKATAQTLRPLSHRPRSVRQPQPSAPLPEGLGQLTPFQKQQAFWEQRQRQEGRIGGARELPHVPVEITTVLVAHSLQLSLRRCLVEEMQLLGTVTEVKTSVAGRFLHINQL